MEKCILFGTGLIAQKAFRTLSGMLDVVAFSDNDISKQGKQLYGKEVIDPNHIEKDRIVIICSSFYKEIFSQLHKMGIKTIFQFDILGCSLVKLSEDDYLCPVSGIIKYEYFKKRGTDPHILFVQINPNIRAHKIAEALHNKGIDVSFAYLGEWLSIFDDYKKYYTNLVHFCSISDFLDYVNNSDYSIIHSFNAPDYLTIIMQCTNKYVVHDNADFESINRDTDFGVYAMEYVANYNSDAAVYVSEACRNLAIDRFGLRAERTIVIENFPSEEATRFEDMPKISDGDGEIHAVYYGGVVNNPNHPRYFNDIWKRIAQSGVHVHFYSQGDEEYCKELDKIDERIHFEGRVQAADLLRIISQYDCGLVLYQELPRYKFVMDITIANKIYEYAAAGLPQAVGNFFSYLQVVEKYRLGKRFYWDLDIKNQFKEICMMKVQKSVLKENKLTMEHQIQKLIDYYKLICSSD